MNFMEGIEMEEKIGEKIKNLLLENNISQKDLSVRLNLSEATISKYISGERKPKIDMVVNLATALNTTVDYLLGTEKENVDFAKLGRILARSKNELSQEQKRKLINILLTED